jgi:hypothetical protein
MHEHGENRSYRCRLGMLVVGLALGATSLLGTLGLARAAQLDLAGQVEVDEAWLMEVIDSGSLFAYSSLAIDPYGHLHVAYCNMSYTPTLMYASYSGSAWYTVTADAGPARVGEYASIGLASTAPYTPHIAYFD